MGEIDIFLQFTTLTTIDLAFSEMFVEFTLVQIFNYYYFSYGNDETRSQNPLIPIWKPNCFGQNLCVSVMK